VFASQSEFEQARQVVDASKAAGVKYIVFSSLPNLANETNGKLTRGFFFDSKSEIEDYIKSSGLPHSFIYPGSFLENAWKYVSILLFPFSFEGIGSTRVHPFLCDRFKFLKPSAQNPTELEYSVTRFTPEHTQPFTWVERDFGVAVLTLLKNYQDRPQDVLGNKFYALTERLKLGEYMSILERVLEKKVNYIHVETTGLEAADQIADFQREYGWYSAISAPDPRLLELGAKFGTVEQFVRENKERLLAAVQIK
jgi:hypothetical protein